MGIKQNINNPSCQILKANQICVTKGLPVQANSITSHQTQ